MDLLALFEALKGQPQLLTQLAQALAPAMAPEISKNLTHNIPELAKAVAAHLGSAPRPIPTVVVKRLSGDGSGKIITIETTSPQLIAEQCDHLSLLNHSIGELIQRLDEGADDEEEYEEDRRPRRRRRRER